MVGELWSGLQRFPRQENDHSPEAGVPVAFSHRAMDSKASKLSPFVEAIHGGVSECVCVTYGFTGR
jgi:hypothetical protein